MVTAFLASGADLSDEKVCEYVAERVHDELFAYNGRYEAQKQYGVKVNPLIHGFRPRSELTLAERRDKVQIAKKNSTCRKCGQKGHWQGDLVCPARNRNANADRTRSTAGGDGNNNGSGAGNTTDKKPDIKKRHFKYRGRSGYTAIAVDAEPNEP